MFLEERRGWWVLGLVHVFTLIYNFSNSVIEARHRFILTAKKTFFFCQETDVLRKENLKNEN